MPIELMVISEEIQEKMKGLYHRYQQLQRDGSVTIKANEAQDLLAINKALFGTNFCTTCQDAILFALAACFRNYHIEEMHKKEFYGIDIYEPTKHNLTEEFNNADIETRALVKFIGTKNQAKQIKAAFHQFNKTETIPSNSEILTEQFKSWFKEV